MALVDVRRAYFLRSVVLSPEDYQASDELMCGLLQHCLNGTRAAAQNWEGSACIDTPRSQVDEKDRVPMRVASLHRRPNIIVATCTRRRQHDWWRTIGSGTPHQHDLKNNEMKKTGDR